jgi:hypothetical protein
MPILGLVGICADVHLGKTDHLKFLFHSG